MMFVPFSSSRGQSHNECCEPLQLGNARRSLDWGSKSFDAYCLGDLHSQIPTR